MKTSGQDPSLLVKVSGASTDGLVCRLTSYDRDVWVLRRIEYRPVARNFPT